MLVGYFGWTLTPQKKQRDRSELSLDTLSLDTEVFFRFSRFFSAVKSDQAHELIILGRNKLQVDRIPLFTSPCPSRVATWGRKQKGKRGVGFLSLLALRASHREAHTTGY
uniref:Uncharacterized protein n=1 Tax=Thalassia hemprichii TaxID=55496 RepID=A0A4Y1KDH7_9LILI|nr:hypothetical protein [Thalassia hemprichii]YP_009667429.1 hypothetical protein [Thalassia hemprichii]ATP74962.1 hypothetical protein [Thalassia hemprichii]ATP74986.1 hypothetical protein [Thalassia hemprichii]